MLTPHGGPPGLRSTCTHILTPHACLPPHPQRGMTPQSAPAALPAGRPIADAIDLELEELRRKAKQ
jgi:hypothetical protein